MAAYTFPLNAEQSSHLHDNFKDLLSVHILVNKLVI